MTKLDDNDAIKIDCPENVDNLNQQCYPYSRSDQKLNDFSNKPDFHNQFQVHKHRDFLKKIIFI